jgi:pantoate kinase
VLADATDDLTQAGTRALSMLVGEPTLPRFMRAARQFSREADLVTPAVREVVLDVSDAGGTAAMAMLGETVFALGTGLSDAGYDPAVCAIHPGGAMLEEQVE